MDISPKLRAALKSCNSLSVHEKCSLVTALLREVMEASGSDSIGFSFSRQGDGETCVIATQATTDEQKQRFEKAVELLSIINPGDSLISLEKKTAEKFMRNIS